MKCFWAALLCVIMLLIVTQPYARCDTDSETGYTYTVAEGKAILTGYQGQGGKVKVPSALGGLPVTEIGFGAFSNQTTLTDITLPEGITVLQGNAFWGCASLAHVSLPESLAAIGARAFANCVSLKNIRLPSAVNVIAPMAFYTGTLTDISVAKDNAAYQVIDGVLFDKAQKMLHSYPDKKAGDTYIVPEGTLALGEDAFFTCYNLKNVILPESLTAIGDNAFYSCGNITALDLPDSLTVIGAGAFSYSSLISKIIIPKSVVSIGYGAFAATNMDKVVLEGGNAVYKAVDGVLYDKINKVLHTYPNKKNSNDYAVEDGTKSIADFAFIHAFSLADIKLPESILSIGTSSFAYCTGLSSITLPSNLSDIGQNAFYTCTALSSIIIPEGVIRINSGAFDSCISLASITIPDSVTEIGYGTFNNCPLLTIHASDGSYARKYSAENNIPFAIK
jgi:hypothetical protein